jgi:hypothetical protein
VGRVVGGGVQAQKSNFGRRNGLLEETIKDTDGNLKR